MNLQALQLHPVLQKDIHFCFKILLSIIFFKLNRATHWYTVNIGLCASGFTTGLTNLQALQLHAFQQKDTPVLKYF